MPFAQEIMSSVSTSSSVYDLPAIEECLFGPTGVRPSMPATSNAKASSDRKDKKSKKREKHSKATTTTRKKFSKSGARGGGLKDFLERGGLPADDSDIEHDNDNDNQNENNDVDDGNDANDANDGGGIGQGKSEDMDVEVADNTNTNTNADHPHKDHTSNNNAGNNADTNTTEPAKAAANGQGPGNPQDVDGDGDVDGSTTGVAEIATNVSTTTNMTTGAKTTTDSHQGNDGPRTDGISDGRDIQHKQNPSIHDADADADADTNAIDNAISNKGVSSSTFSEVLQLDIPSPSPTSTARATSRNGSIHSSNGTGSQDDIVMSHWSEPPAAAAPAMLRTPALQKHYFADDYDPNDHTIDLPLLRTLSSQGIPDEGSFRALTWRVLLGLLPYRKIHSNWGKSLQAQRDLYRELCLEYFCNPIDGGRHLRGTWTKKLRHCTKQQRHKYVHSIQRLDGDDRKNQRSNDHGSDDNEDTDEDIDFDIRGQTASDDDDNEHDHDNSDDDHDDDDDDDGRSVGTHQTEHSRMERKTRKGQKAYSYYRSIEQQLAPKLREQWQKTGLSSSLDANSVVKPYIAPELSKATSAAPSSASISTATSTARSPFRRRRRNQDSKNQQSSTSAGTTSKNSNGTNNAETFASVTDNSLSRSTLRGLSQNQLAVPKALKRNETATPSAMKAFLEQAKSLASIRKDTVRTHPDLYFFLEPDQNLGLRRYAALERILFIWAKLNKGVCYVQGMNEIVGTLFYVLANDVNADWAKHAEADTYWLFDVLMRELRDIYMPDKDHDDDGIHARLEDIEILLSRHDPQLQQHLQQMGINTSLYAVRWVTTLLSREFLLPDTIRMWDSIFAATDMEDFLRYVCVTMIVMIRNDLMRGDFSECLRLLHDYPSQNVDQLLDSSRALQMYDAEIMRTCRNPASAPVGLRKYRTGGTMSLHQALQVVDPPRGLVMAFGYPQVVLDKAYQHAIATAAAAAAAAAATSTNESSTSTSIFGKAKRFWSGWKDTSAQSVPAATSAPTTPTVDTSIGTSPSTSTSPSWSNLQDGATKSAQSSNNHNNDTNGTPPLVNESVGNVGGIERNASGNASNGTNVDAIASMPPEPPSRIWKRGTSEPLRTMDSSSSKGTETSNAASVASSTAVALPVSEKPARSRFWNRARAQSSGATANQSVVNPDLIQVGAAPDTINMSFTPIVNTMPTVSIVGVAATEGTTAPSVPPLPPSSSPPSTTSATSPASRIWNRGRASAQTMGDTSDVGIANIYATATTMPTMSTMPRMPTMTGVAVITPTKSGSEVAAAGTSPAPNHASTLTLTPRASDAGMPSANGGTKSVAPGRAAPPSRMWNRSNDANSSMSAPGSLSPTSKQEATPLSLSNLPAEVSERVSRDILEILSS